MFRNLKLKDRILWGYSIPIILLAVGSIVVNIETKLIAEKYQLVDQGHTGLERLRIVENDFLRMQKAARGYFLTREEKFFNEYDRATKNFFITADEANQILLNQEQKDKLKEISALGAEIDRLYREAISLSRAKNLNKGLSLWRANVVPLLEKVEVLLKDFDAKQEEILAERQQAAREDLDFLNTIVLVSTMIAAIMAIAISLLIASNISQKVKEAVSAISDSSTEIAYTVSEQERMANNQAVAVGQTTTVMDELSASSRSTAEQADAAATGAQQVLTLVTGSQNTIEENEYNWGANSSLRDRVKQIANNILRLSDQTHQIGTISTLVSELASQTNMLALNAAVEAVRAGENGKGFAIVAAEIRKLAEQSRKSAEKINTIVTDIKNATNATVLVADEGTKTVEIIVKAIDNIATNSQQISLTAKQQAIAIQQVVEAMNNINQGAAQTAISIAQTKETTQQLNEAALNLEAVV